MTSKRKKIYNCISESSSPLNASQIHRETGNEMDLATVYRGLQYLEEGHYISSFVFSCDERGMERYYIKARTEHTHYMHCRKCHRFFPMPLCPFKDSMVFEKKIDGFLVENHTITLTGLCSTCQ
ncbi:Fur family transcriptional regulator [Spirochaeta isovalerica]|uniref:Fur family ferric uptake transcriptional regulator n=1 Tax=Spirochaeta isovalerica TaxID=150 RepID=A0A841R892_9SPIO|nr:transcriptional repressor [Spirochaeta isovalerica]MBB6480036.1 Fur family ferric uptake transcriptional regulator [Spirochaeta isovalerica]